MIEGRALIGGEVSEAEIGIEGGRIAAVGKSVRGGDKRIRFGGGRIIVPGFVDPHVHMRDPGLTRKEDFATGTLSALHGGVTCVLDMPNTVPPAADARSVMEKKEAIRRKAHIDYGLFAAVSPGMDAESVAPLVAGFKLFMGSTTGSLLVNGDADIARAMGSISKTGKRVSVHAEDDSMIARGREECCMDHLRNRPVAAELGAIGRLARFKGMKVNICHVTSAEAAAAAARLGFATEATLHHLFFDASRCTGAEYKVNPPIRDPATREALYAELLRGGISMFGSDHAPHTAEEKSEGFDSAPSGIPGVETTAPILMNLARKGGLPLAMVSGMGSRAPAEAFGLNKGAIEAGRDADLAVFDMRSPSVIRADALHSKAGHTPYGGWEAVFPDTVLLRGSIQLAEGELCGERIGEDVCGGVRG